MSKAEREQVLSSIEKAREDPSRFLELVQRHVSELGLCIDICN